MPLINCDIYLPRFISYLKYCNYFYTILAILAFAAFVLSKTFYDGNGALLNQEHFTFYSIDKDRIYCVILSSLILAFSTMYIFRSQREGICQRKTKAKAGLQIELIIKKSYPLLSPVDLIH